ncbi:hypothetical protein LOC67_08550 [Stieleria sp. JC731]|uniref:hypothetical protein n=1 Tax=Pirellulaceae TaxID=2691357 RepID=UPI001E4F02CE|nr:hypothetical protein [Stieleria sp. JC731]MCC9600609.1 hypothetical protein [Stieleria sp. JC731]
MNTMLLTNDRDRTYLAIVITPVILLVAFVATAAFKWSRNDAAIDAKLANLFPAEVLEDPLGETAKRKLLATYPQTKQAEFKEPSIDRHQTEIALRTLSYELEYIDSLVKDATTAGVEFEMDSYYEEIFQRAEPLLERLDFPNHPENIFSTGAFFNSKFNYELEHKQYDQAIKTLGYALREHVGGRTHALKQRLIYAISGSDWSLEQIESIEDSFNGVLRENVTQAGLVPPKHFELYDHILWYQGKSNSYYVGRYPDSPFPIAASVRLATLDYELAVMDSPNQATISGIKSRIELNDRYLRRLNEGLDTSLQIPFYRSNSRIANRSVSTWVAMDANLNRFLKTAIGIRKFELNQGRFPKTLDELSKIGFNPNDSMDVTNQPFNYHEYSDDETGTSKPVSSDPVSSDADSVILGNAAEPFVKSVTNVIDNRLAVTRDDWRGQIIAEYQEVWFARSEKAVPGEAGQ